ncbi:MAG: glycoside hydrolase family 25 protein [Clostridia bacterium]|nr:glycoside hydrolase family 25 protein [Clostridia bacterium]
MKKKLIVALAILVAVILVFSLKGEEKGIDVSAYQGDINWEKVDVDFVMVRAGYRGADNGIIHLDSKFYQNMDGAKEQGIKTGVYFFSTAVNVREAKEEAKTAVSLASGYDPMYIAFDMEQVHAGDRTQGLTREQNTRNALAFCKVVKKAGFKPIIYGNINYFKNQVILSEVDKYPIWLADYDSNGKGNIKWDMLQYSCKGKVKGIKHKVDLNVLK